jgi:Zn-finger nucleic acid-binding protein
MTERQGVEIDYCPQCRGVWLDRGELDKLIERSQAAGVGTRYAKDHEPDSDRRGYRGDDHGHRRKSWLSEIFD